MGGLVILDLCGGTGSWSRPYRDAGYDVIVVDPLGDGFKGTVADFLKAIPSNVHGILVAPPATTSV